MEKKSIPDMKDELDKFDLSNSYSSTECTGLITVPPEDDAELESYQEIYDFGPYDKK